MRIGYPQKSAGFEPGSCYANHPIISTTKCSTIAVGLSISASMIWMCQRSARRFIDGICRPCIGFGIMRRCWMMRTR